MSVLFAYGIHAKSLPPLHLEHQSALIHPHQVHTHTQVGSFIALMLFLMALHLPLRIDVTSIRLCLWAFLVEAGAQDSDARDPRPESIST